jgi:hypothetical protein
MSHPERNCMVCLAADRRVVATCVAAAACGTEWFECEQHGPRDNLLDAPRVGRVLIAEWFKRMPMPSGELCPKS